MFLFSEYSLSNKLLLCIFIHLLYHKNCNQTGGSKMGEENSAPFLKYLLIIYRKVFIFILRHISNFILRQV